MDKKRLYSLDSLRALALFLMVQQHLGPWLWRKAWINMFKLYKNNKVFMGINSLGGMAAPIFILLAGIGIVFISDHNKTKGKLLKRGVVIIGLGYLLNFLSPSWFIPESWYVLHLIGFSTVLSIFFLKINSVKLFLLSGIIFIIEGPLQVMLKTPDVLTTSFFRKYSGISGIIRYAFVEGYFPVFPWMALFLVGIISGRWIKLKKYKHIIIAGFLTLLVSLILSVIGNIFDLPRYYRLVPNFYPTNLPMMVMLLAFALIILYIFIKFEDFFQKYKIIGYPGRLTLTFLFAHIFIFKEVSDNLGFYKIFNKSESLFIITMVILGMYVISYIWKKAEFIGSIEWVIRKIYK